MLGLLLLLVATGLLIAGIVTSEKLHRAGAFTGAAIALVLGVMVSSAVIIEAGHVGIVFNRSSGIEKRTLGSGFHLVLPYVQIVEPHDVRTQRLSLTNEQAVSSDQQVIHTDVTLNYHPLPSDLWALYSEVGFDYGDKIVAPVVREALKAEVAKHKVDALLANREVVSQNIRNYVTKKLSEKHLVMEMISLTNVRFSNEYQAAVERKQVALQNAQAKENELQQAKIQASITRTEADAEAYKIEAVQKALGSSPDYVKLEAVRKLNPNAEIIYVPHGSSVLIPGSMPGSK